MLSFVFSTQSTAWMSLELRTPTTWSAFLRMVKCAPGVWTCSPSHKYVQSVQMMWETISLFLCLSLCVLSLQDSLELVFKQNKAVAVTSMAFPLGDVNNFVVGSEDGSVYTACRHGRWEFADLWPLWHWTSQSKIYGWFTWMSKQQFDISLEVLLIEYFSTCVLQ